MKLAYSITMWLVALAFVVSPNKVFAITNSALFKHEFSKTIKKDFSIVSDGEVRLSNKYGRIDVKSWDKNRVKIEVLIIVNATSESNAQDVFERITIAFENGNDFVTATTEIGGNSSSWWGSWGGDSKSDFKINYDVYMPGSAFLELKNKYGDAHVEELNGSANVNIKYGNFSLDGIGQNLEVSLGYGNGTVVKAGKIDANISYSKFRIQNCENLNSSSKYSKITINNANDVRINSAYDTYDIGTVRNYQSQGKYDNVSIQSAHNLTVFSKYSDYNLGEIINSADFDLTYGGARINKVNKGFSEMRIVGRYADYKVSVEEGASYQLNASADYAGIRYPQAMNVSYEEEKGVSHEVEGYVKIKEARSIIKVELDYGGLKID